MKRFLCLLLGAASAALGICPGAGKLHSTHANFTADLLGPADSRLYTWGDSAAMTKALTFKPPAGCAVEITHISGELVAWPVFGAVPPGTQAGTLVSACRTSTDGASQYADFATDGCALYVQLGTSGDTGLRSFNEDVVEGMLDSDNRLNFKFADWLNNTGLIIHMEVTVKLFFRFVAPAGGGAQWN